MIEGKNRSMIFGPNDPLAPRVMFSIGKLRTEGPPPVPTPTIAGPRGGVRSI